MHFILTPLKYAGAARVKTGIDLARELTASNESMKVLLMSARDLPPHGLAPEWRFLAKPFGISALLDSVNELGVPVSAERR
jgi:hypothetical protein